MTREGGIETTRETAYQRRMRRARERIEHVEKNGNICELCGAPPGKRGLYEDHDHKTGAHRGWLCFRCNRALPTYVTVEWCVKAAEYLLRARISAERRGVAMVSRECDS